jgi:hypothetical protein
MIYFQPQTKIMINFDKKMPKQINQSPIIMLKARKPSMLAITSS